MKEAVMYQPNEPLVVEEISLEAPRDGEVCRVSAQLDTIEA